ncbi:hypothetical protein Leryth_005301 [Lithospermum erythrorhizon]|nr:hypothetical protein Leryth_005301 [Lithospermum erythrorhizon]
MLMVVRSRSDPESHNTTSLTPTNGERENQTHNNDVTVENKKSKDGYGGSFGWGWGGGRRRDREEEVVVGVVVVVLMEGGGGGGGVSGKKVDGEEGWRGRKKHNGAQLQKKRDFSSNYYRLGEFAQCMVEGRCKGMRLDCPLHCGGPCYYDCRYMCKAHCRRNL